MLYIHSSWRQNEPWYLIFCILQYYTQSLCMLIFLLLAYTITLQYTEQRRFTAMFWKTIHTSLKYGHRKFEKTRRLAVHTNNIIKLTVKYGFDDDDDEDDEDGMNSLHRPPEAIRLRCTENILMNIYYIMCTLVGWLVLAPREKGVRNDA